MPNRSIEVVPDAASLAAAAATKIIAASESAINQRGVFSIALSGGNTPKNLFELLATEPYSRQIVWEKWDVYWSDERCVPPSDKDSNYRMAREALLSRVPVPEVKIHRMKGELDPQAAATEYGQLLKEKFADGGVDLNLLGMGDDGHTASLFPQTQALSETRHRCVANFIPKLNVWRITMSAPFINRSKLIIVLLSGAAKAQRLQEVLHGPRDPHRLPIQMIDPANGEMIWLMDSAAAGRA